MQTRLRAPVAEIVRQIIRFGSAAPFAGGGSAYTWAPVAILASTLAKLLLALLVFK